MGGIIFRTRSTRQRGGPSVLACVRIFPRSALGTGEDGWVKPAQLAWLLSHEFRGRGLTWGLSRGQGGWGTVTVGESNVVRQGAPLHSLSCVLS